MITSSEAEKLAKQKMEEYVNACGCDAVEDAGNALSKMVCMCGLAMCATVGQDEAVSRLEEIAAYVAETQTGKHWSIERSQ